MADNTILTPGCQENTDTPIVIDDSTQYLERDNFLSEYAEEAEKSVVRENLNVYPKNSVYTKDETDTNIATTVTTAINKHLNAEDPHGTLSAAKELVTDMAKTDGSTPFTAPQTGVDPVSDNHLTTKKFVTKLLKDHTKLTGSEDPHKILPEVITLLQQYVKTSEIYSKSDLYIKKEIDNLLKSYVKKDGTTPFTIAQVGVDPTIDSHLATKRYVDKTLYAHLVDVDPHGFLSILNNRLAAYAKTANVYDKTQTYSRTQVDSLINKWVTTSIEAALQDYMSSVDDKFETIRKEGYVKSDGSVAFKNPQAGVNAVEDNELVTLSQLKSQKEELETEISTKECQWITSGPAETTVGFVEDNTPLPDTMTLQEICDAIFYGKSITITAPEYTMITEKAQITVCIHGSTGLIDVAQLYQNGELIYTFTGSDFEDGCVTVDSLPITEDTDFTFKVTYTNGSIHEDTVHTKCCLPVFVGLLPKWKSASTITMEYLKEIELQDTDGTQNRFVSYGADLTSITFKYVFTDADLRHPIVVVPKSYPNLEGMVTKSQSFGKDAFTEISDIPLTVDGVKSDVIYKIYVYKEALSSLNQDVTYNFVNE